MYICLANQVKKINNIYIYIEPSLKVYFFIYFFDSKLKMKYEEIEKKRIAFLNIIKQVKNDSDSQFTEQFHDTGEKTKRNYDRWCTGYMENIKRNFFF